MINSCVHLRNFNKQHLISAKFYINNKQSIGNQNAKFQLNLFTQTIGTATFVRSPQNVKCPILGNRLFNLDNVHCLLGNSAINFLALHLFFCLNSLIKTRLSAKTPFCYFLCYFDCINKRHFRYRYSIFDNFGKNSISEQNLAVVSGIYCGLSVLNVIHIRLDLTFYCTMSRGSVFLPERV